MLLVRFLRHVVPVVLVLLSSLSGCASPPLDDSEAAIALEDIAAADKPSRLKAQTPPPSRRSYDYVVDGRRYTGDVYRSAQGVRAGLVLVPGVFPAGKDDARLVATAKTLARLQFAVLVPDLKGLRRNRLRAHDVREVADAFRYLLSRPELVPAGHAGIAGFSYGGGLVVLAALEPDVREQVRFTVSFGGYYDLRSIVTYFTTGHYRETPGADWRYRSPHPYLKWVFTLSNADLLEHAGDRATLRDLAQAMADDDNDIDITTAEFSADAQALYALLNNEDPDRVPALIEKLSPRIRNELAGINPAAHDLSAIRAQVILMHGRGDTFIPYTESIAMARALPPGQVQLFIIEGYAHTSVRPQREDIPQFLDMMQALLDQRMAVE
ncbi:alpha/beta hydrolase family protein [Sulfuriflexus mobilis]|uniref:alpha/beta hydrolase family protein n=1 Tax=Sulfuriflexus mobilis TaxID=1811807 RepID=UPI000F82CE0F|nr:alpha/beta hydrolase [Sulfuriflexus mobilis]